MTGIKSFSKLCLIYSQQQPPVPRKLTDICYPISSSINSENPKSINTNLPLASLQQMFEGLMSQWMIFRECIIARQCLRSDYSLFLSIFTSFKSLHCSISNSMQFLQIIISNFGRKILGPIYSELAQHKIMYSLITYLKVYKNLAFLQGMHFTARFYWFLLNLYTEAQLPFSIRDTECVSLTKGNIKILT